MPTPTPPPVHAARGPRALESWLLAALAPLLEGPETAQLARPVRLVVASRSLREHGSRRLVARFGALAGLRVQTLHALALEVVERSGGLAPAGDLLFPLLVRRCARAEPILRQRLEDLDDGYAVVEASVHDLLDAGFEAAHRDAVLEAAVQALPPGAALERARALVRVAAQVAEALGAGGVGHRSLLLRAAREALERDPEGALPSRALFVHGFADATGLQGDLIEALVRLRGARVGIDRPADPIEPTRVDPGVAFGERFTARLGGAAGIEEDGAAPEPPRIEVLHAPSPHAELRGVAERVRALLDAGTEPEEIGLVLRHLDPYRVPIRLHFGRLGIPFSGVGAAAPPGPASDRLSALALLLRLRERTPVERWLDAAQRLPGLRGALGPGLRMDLLLGFHVLGAARLAEAAAKPRGGPDLALPVRLGLGGSGEGVAPRRRLERRKLDAAIGAAAELCAGLAGWPERGPLAMHRQRLAALLDALGWPPDAPEARVLGFSAAGGSAFELGRDDLALLVQRAVADFVEEPLGGRGAGVQVLDAMEARGRSFQHLFVAGLSRDSFPRSIVDDPLLSEALRLRLRPVLEALPVKGEGHDEERYLFAQLLAAAPRVTLSAPLADEDGLARPLSPLLEGLRFAPRVPEPVALPPLLAPPTDGAPPRPAHEQATLAGLYGRRDGFEAALALALDEARGAAPGAEDGRQLARARCAVLAEIDPGLREARRLGPYYGFVGAMGPGDPRRRDLSVTAAETVARCAWRAFVERVLRVQALPDPHGDLPSGDPSGAARLIGQLVHAVLERIARDSLGEGPCSLDEALQREPVAVPWPEPEALEALVAECADALVQEEAVGMPGYARLLALHARGPLARARSLDWPEAGQRFGLLGVELVGSLALPDGAALSFRVDRVDSDGSALRLVDYKTGKPPSDKKREATRLADLQRRVARGLLLQSTAYARAGAQRGRSAEGRYLYLGGADDLPQRVFGTLPDDAALGGAFDAALGVVLEAWRLGSFAPHLFDTGKDEEHHACERCPVKDACLRGDSGARRRLADWLARPGAGRSVPEQALARLWRLHEDPA